MMQARRPTIFPAAARGAILLLSLSVAPVAIPPVRAQEFNARAAAELSRARALADSGRAEDALRALERASEADPTSLYLLQRRAEMLHDLGQPREVIELLAPRREEATEPSYRLLLGWARQAVGDLPGAAEELTAAYAMAPSRETLEALTMVLSRLRRWDEVAAHAARALEQEASSVELHLLRGRALGQGGHVPEARAEFEAALGLAPGHAGALWALGQMAEGEGDWEEARSRYEALLESRPDDPTVHSALLRAFSEGEDAAGALERARKLVEAHPASAGLRGMLGALEYRGGQPEQAAADLQKAVEMGADGYGLRFTLGQCYLELGRAEEGRKEIERALEIDPEQPGGWLTLAVTLMATKDFEGASRAIDRAESVEPSSGYVPYVRGLLLSRQKKYQEALGQLQRALAILPDNRDVLFNLAAVQDNLGNKAAAGELLQRLLARQPDDAPALNYLGYLWAEQAIHLDEALALIERALLKDPENGYYIDSLAWAHFQKGDLDRALEEMKRSVARVADDPVIFEHLGDAHHRLGHLEEAREAWTRSLSIDQENERVKKKLESLPPVRP